MPRLGHHYDFECLPSGAPDLMLPPKNEDIACDELTV